MIQRVKTRCIPILVVHVLGITRNGTQLLSIAAQNLRLKDVLPTAAVAQAVHDWIDFCFKHFRELKRRVNG